MRRAEILVQDRFAGVLEEHDLGYRFTYAQAYQSDPSAMAVSLSLPLQAEPYEDKRLFPFFDGLIRQHIMVPGVQAKLSLHLERNAGAGRLTLVGLDGAGRSGHSAILFQSII